jgi:Fur family peroxide stress response transcriptional regulator
MDMQNVTELNEIAAKNFDGIIDFCTMTFYGKCGNCIKKS